MKLPLVQLDLSLCVLELFLLHAHLMLDHCFLACRSDAGYALALLKLLLLGMEVLLDLARVGLLDSLFQLSVELLKPLPQLQVNLLQLLNTGTTTLKEDSYSLSSLSLRDTDRRTLALFNCESSYKYT